jgi:hydroxymethylglutaryl-CoA lyase
LADTTGISDAGSIGLLFKTLIPAFPDITIAAHLHAEPAGVEAKVAAAYAAGCRNFDTAIKGYGGCPMASDILTGNIATETVFNWAQEHAVPTGLNEDALQQAQFIADRIFNRYH